MVHDMHAWNTQASTKAPIPVPMGCVPIDTPHLLFPYPVALVAHRRVLMPVHTVVLQRNADLRGQVVSGAVDPAALVAMDSRQLATSQQQQEFAHLKVRRCGYAMYRKTVAMHLCTA